MNDALETTLGFYEFFDRYVIATFHEGVTVTRDCAPEIIELLNSRMQNRFGFISNKIHSYSADPFIMRDVVPAVPLLASYCNVVYGRQSRDYTKYGNFVVPETFPLGNFNLLDEGIAWSIAMASRDEGCQATDET